MFPLSSRKLGRLMWRRKDSALIVVPDGFRGTCSAVTLHCVLYTVFSSFYFFFFTIQYPPFPDFMTRVKLIWTGTGEGPSAAILNTLLSAPPHWVMVVHTWKQLCAVFVNCSSIKIWLIWGLINLDSFWVFIKALETILSYLNYLS